MSKTAVAFAQAQNNLAAVLEQVAHNGDIVVIERDGAQDVALISAAELQSLQETLYLLQSPNNARRLREAIAETAAGGGRILTPAQLREEFGLAESQ